MGSKVAERTAFYRDVALDGIDSCPPANYFEDVLYAIEDMQKQINDLRTDNERMRKELGKIFK